MTGSVSAQGRDDTIGDTNDVKDIPVLCAETLQVPGMQMADKDKGVHFHPGVFPITVIHGIRSDLVGWQLPREMTLGHRIPTVEHNPASDKLEESTGRVSIHEVPSITPVDSGIADQACRKQEFPTFGDPL